MPRIYPSDIPHVLTFFDNQVIAASTHSITLYTKGLKDTNLVTLATSVAGSGSVIGIEVLTSMDNVNFIHNTSVIDKQTQGGLVRLTAPTAESYITLSSPAKLFQSTDCLNLMHYTKMSVEVSGASPSITLTAKMYPYA